MQRERFADRLERDSYPAEIVVGVFRSSPDESDAVWIDERLFARLTMVARAYELHTLPLLDGQDPIQLNRPQVQAAGDELHFTVARLNYPLAAETAGSLVSYLDAQLRSPRHDLVVTIDGN